MNIFILDINPEICAQYHCDKHVVKMIVETAQLLSTAHHILGVNEFIKDEIYKKTHENHPCAIWVRKSSKNYEWLCELGLNLCKEYTHRYGKTHSCESLMYLLSVNIPNNIPISESKTSFALAMPAQYISSASAVQSYQNYYMEEKRHIAKWKNRNTPIWYK